MQNLFWKFKRECREHEPDNRLSRNLQAMWLGQHSSGKHAAKRSRTFSFFSVSILSSATHTSVRKTLSHLIVFAVLKVKFFFWSFFCIFVFIFSTRKRKTKVSWCFKSARVHRVSDFVATAVKKNSIFLNQAKNSQLTASNLHRFKNNWLKISWSNYIKRKQIKCGLNW